MDKALEEFTAYFVKNYPGPRTVIFDPEWHAPKIFRAAIAAYEAETGWRFKVGDRVTKIKGSSWTGRVVGVYETSLTPIGYCVESEREPGSVQIYPESALAAAPSLEQEGG
jgi:hypothetical protein